MPTIPLSEVIQHLRSAALARDGAGLTDGQLLECFVTHGDQAAFAALVRRHSAMVWGVCRRLLHGHHDAEDAFQATFLVLVRRAASIVPREMIANWLYGAARQTALKAQSLVARRKTRERQVVDMPEPAVKEQDLRTDLQLLLDEELSRLPAKYRIAIVLCDLEGTTRKNAARQLGVPEGTLSGRLTRGRELLAKRLARRGVAVTSVTLAAFLAQQTASACVPAMLVSSTIKAAGAFAAGTMAVSVQVAALAEAMLKTMVLTKAKLVLMLLLGPCLAAAGLSVAAMQARTAPDEKRPADTKQATPPKPVKETKIRVDRYGDPLPEGAIARLGTLRFRHGGGTIQSLLLSRDGKTLVSDTSFGDGIVRAWDLGTGKLLHEFPGHFEENGAVALSPDGKTLVTGDERLIRFWDLASGHEIRQLKAPLGSVQGLAISPDGKMLASGHGEQTVLLWDLATGRNVARLKANHNRLTFLQFTSEGQTLVTGGGLDQTVRLFDVATRKERHQITRPDMVRGLALAPDGSLLALGAQHGPATIWDVRTGELIRELRGAPFVGGAAFSADGKILATAEFDQKATRESIVFWDVATGKELHRLHDRGGLVWSLVFAPDGKTIVAGSAGTIRLWDATTGEERGPAPGNPGYVGSVAAAPTGRTVAYIADSSVRLWDLTEAKEVGRFPGHHWSIALSPDGKTLAGGTDVNTVNLWDVTSHRLIRHLESDPKKGGYEMVAYYHLAFSSDAKFFASAGRGLLPGDRGADPVVQLWDLATGQEGRRLRLNDREKEFLDVESVAISPDGQTLAASGRLMRGGSKMRLWDLATGQELTLLNARLNEQPDPSLRKGPTLRTRVAFSRDGKLLAMNRWQKPISVWETATGKERVRLNGHQDSTVCVAFSPDGQTLASSGRDNTIRLWDLATGHELGQLKGHRGPANSLAFSGDGRTLISGGDDATVLVWEVAAITNRERRTIQLTPEEWEIQWADLASPDAARAHAAIMRLTAAGPTTVEKLKDRLLPATAPDPARLAQLLRDLESDTFGVRLKATQELERLGDQARPTVEQALTRPGASLEYRRRLEHIRDQIALPSGDGLRGLRAVEVLEHIATLDARRVLESVSRGAPEARLTREAKGAQARLAVRFSTKSMR